MLFYCPGFSLSYPLRDFDNRLHNIILMCLENCGVNGPFEVQLEP